MTIKDHATTAQRYYNAYFGPKADELTADDALSVEQLIHSRHGPCRWEILLATGGPAARVLVEVDQDLPASATFQFQDWGTSWSAPANQDPEALLGWVYEYFSFDCPYCAWDQRH